MAAGLLLKLIQVLAKEVNVAWLDGVHITSANFVHEDLSSTRGVPTNPVELCIATQVSDLMLVAFALAGIDDGLIRRLLEVSFRNVSDRDDERIDERPTAFDAW